MKRLFTLLTAIAFIFVGTFTVPSQASSYSSDGLKLVWHPDLEKYAPFSHVCGGVTTTGKYFAVLGAFDGTIFANYTDKTLEFFPGAKSKWRECRTYKNPKNGKVYAYVVTEGGGNDVAIKKGEYFPQAYPGGIQIFELGTPVKLVNTYVDKFNSAHTITIDPQRGWAFVNGSNWQGPKPGSHAGHGTRSTQVDHTLHLGGFRILDIATDPENPRDLGFYGEPSKGGPYTHDSYALGEVDVSIQREVAPHQFKVVTEKWYVVYLADIFQGFIRILNLNNPDKPVEEFKVQTPLYTQGIATHNVWASEDKKWLFATEETGGSSLLVYNIANPARPRFVTAYRSESVADTSIIHNVVVKGNIVYCSWYREGVRLIDISNPVHPKEIAFFDSSTKEFGNADPFHGNWSVDVDDQGLVIISDIEEGLFILKRSR